MAVVRITLLLLLPLSVGVVAADESTTQFPVEQIEFFEAKIRPLLIEHCYDCHSTDAKKLQAGLYVDSREALIKGGDSGPSVVVGKPDESLLIEAVKYESVEMPPKQKLGDQQIRDLETWVKLGAPWPRVTSSPGIQTPAMEINWTEARAAHWAWQPVHKPDVPQVATEGNGTQFNTTSPIDDFVTARRKDAGIKSAPPAEPAVLARRIYVDLIGIPPSPQQVATFAERADRDQQAAIENLVDELLDSPLYGQRWARHWLDVARYSDGYGGFLDNAGLPEAWRYRDWVVNAINDDMPIDRFIELQIAGDLTGDQQDAIATGFFALGPTYRSDGGDPDSIAQAKGETLDDRMDTLTRGLLGITGSCARCHDHKFDPIPQQDYYSLAGIFNNTAVRRIPLDDADVVSRFDQHQKVVNDLKKQIAELDKKSKQNKTDFSTADQQRLDSLNAELAELNRNTPPSYDTAHALHDTGSKDMKVAIRGNLRKEGADAPRRFLRVLAGDNPPQFTKGSGRTDLAAAMIDPQNPLTARVFVNRVWMHHFGSGLVRTPSNFGTLGEAPTHPQLLDWLAVGFIENGWSLKQLHRQIMTSTTYQLGSQYDAASFAVDGDNRLLWRMSPRRMDVEAWRDSLLSVTHELDISADGPPIDNVTSNTRRTLYARVSRNGDQFASDQFLRRFDFPLMRATVAQRPRSIVPQQYLFLMNSQFMVDRANAFVRRLESVSESNADRIASAYEILYCRPPTEQEIQIGLEYVSSKSVEQSEQLSAWTRYAQVLLSSNEFMFVR